MSDESTQQKSRAGLRRQRSIYQVHYNIQKSNTEVMARPLELPRGLDVQAFGAQVAGHRGDAGARYLGLLQCSNGTILKPILKPSQQREVAFYSRLAAATPAQPDLLQLRAFVPHYHGVTKYTYNGYEQEYIMLEDLTQRMLEQCVMDVKIGKRTWDPLATEEKIKSEQSKYALCKQQYGFCIPGYQVCELAAGRVRRLGKDHGKRLQGHMVIDALKRFLNVPCAAGGGGGGGGACRALLLQLLAALWRVQRWARGQRALRLYSSSLLLLYDAARLRACCPPDKSGGKCEVRVTRRALPSAGGGPLGGQLAARGPVYALRRPRAPPRPAPAPPPPPPPHASPWTEALDRLAHNHSFEHNYEDELCKIRANYRTLLDEISSDSPNPPSWATVKIVDFAHAFFNDDDEAAVDENFRDGVDRLVEIFETFLRETEEGVA